MALKSGGPIVMVTLMGIALAGSHSEEGIPDIQAALAIVDPWEAVKPTMREGALLV